MQKITVAFVMNKILFINYGSFPDFSLENMVVLVGKKTQVSGSI